MRRNNLRICFICFDKSYTERLSNKYQLLHLTKAQVIIDSTTLANCSSSLMFLPHHFSEDCFSTIWIGRCESIPKMIHTVGGTNFYLELEGKRTSVRMRALYQSMVWHCNLVVLLPVVPVCSENASFYLRNLYQPLFCRLASSQWRHKVKAGGCLVQADKISLNCPKVAFVTYLWLLMGWMPAVVVSSLQWLLRV